MEKSIFDHYKDRENTKINLVIYGSFGFSAAALYLISGNKDQSNIFVIVMFLLSLTLSLCSFFYWFAADYLAYADYQCIQDKNERKSDQIRPIQSKMALICLLCILASYFISFFATLLAFTKYRLFEVSQIHADQISWVSFIIICTALCAMIIYHYISCHKNLDSE